MTPLLTATPGNPPTYNAGMAETLSWIPVNGAGRPLFAQATYLTNASDISINAGSLSLDLTTTNNKIDTTNLKQDKIITLLNSITAMSIQIDLNTDDLKINVDQVETLLQQLTAQMSIQNRQNGFDFIVPGSTYTGSWTGVTVSSAARIQTIGAVNSNVGTLTAVDLPLYFSFSAPITSIRLVYGHLIAHK
jgi:hypothetical protein